MKIIKYVTDKDKLIKRDKFPHNPLQIALHNVEVELKIAFPHHSFHVVEGHKLMGDAFFISWWDGPTKFEVLKITQKYQRILKTGGYNETHRKFWEEYGGANIQMQRGISEDLLEIVVGNYAEVPTPQKLDEALEKIKYTNYCYLYSPVPTDNKITLSKKEAELCMK